MIDPNKHLSQVQTQKLHVNLCHNHHRGRVTPFTLEINDPTTEISSKTNLVILEAANTTYALIPTLITQKYTVIDVCKNFIHAPFRVPLSFSKFFSLNAHHSTFACFFYFLGKTHIHTD